MSMRGVTRGAGAAVRAQARHLIVDLSGLSYIDAACVRVLAAVGETGADAGVTLTLVAPQPIVVRMLELCGADAVARSIRPRQGRKDGEVRLIPAECAADQVGGCCPGPGSPLVTERGCYG